MHLFLAQTNNSAAGGTFLGIGLVFVLLGLVYAALWIYALISAATRSDLSTTERLIWILLLLFLPGIGTLLYFILAGRRL